MSTFPRLRVSAHIGLALCGGLLLCLFVSSRSIAAPVPAEPEKTPDFSVLKPESIQKYSGAELLIVGKFTSVSPGPVGLSDPPFRTYRLQVSIDKKLRGETAEKELKASYAIRSNDEAVFPSKDESAIIALKHVRGSWVIVTYEKEEKERLQQAILATSFPLGWTVREGKLISPWAKDGKPGPVEGNRCAVTGRPALLAGDKVAFNVEPVPSKKPKEFVNPDGDGEYTLKVKNLSDKEIEVPALLTDGKTIQWNESIVIRCQEKNYPMPGSKGEVKGLKPVVLKAGEEVTGVVQTFGLEGPEWPRGGYRIEFQFCLGEKSRTQSFYYSSRTHDLIREEVLKSLKK
jgi:hypothetical protein